MSLPHDYEGVRVLGEKLAREHARGGGKVVGYLTPCVPAELIEAAGMWPLMLAGGTETSTALGDHYMEDLFDTALRAVFERLLKGEFDYLSAIVLPRANDSAHRLYYYLSEIERTGDAKLPPVLLADIAMTADRATHRYSLEALQRLWSELQALGRRGGEPELKAAIAASNRRTELLTAFATRRHDLAASVTGEEALAVFAAVRMLPGDVFEGGMKALKAAAPQREPARTRVMVCGSAHDGAGLHKLVEAAGGVVVGDYHAAGELSVGGMIDTHLAPLEGILDRYRSLRAASRNVGMAGAETAAFARACGANAAVFSYFPEEEALTWDFPEQKAALEKAGVRVLRLKEQARPFDVAANREDIAAFVGAKR